MEIEQSVWGQASSVDFFSGRFWYEDFSKKADILFHRVQNTTKFTFYLQ